MSALQPAPDLSTSLVDALDHLLERGAVLTGEATLSLAGVDLVYVGLNLLIASVETLRTRGARMRPARAAPAASTPSTARAAPQQPVVAPTQARALDPGDDLHLELRPAGQLPEPEHDAGADQGLARLVLTLVDLLRQLVERQALRRMDGGSLSDGQIERMGLALRDLATSMQELCGAFGLEPEALNLDLGPLGRLLDGIR